MDKDILVQYSDIKQEIKDIGQRIRNLEKDISSLQIVSDTVKGTRPDGTYGNIKITGYPMPEYYRKKEALDRHLELLQEKEAELLELTSQAEEYIESIKKSEIRTMFRLYFIDGHDYIKTAFLMNEAFPKRKISFTDENVKKRIQRFLNKVKNVPQCPD